MTNIALKITDFIGFDLKQNSSALISKSNFIVSGAQLKLFAKQRCDNQNYKEIRSEVILKNVEYVKMEKRSLEDQNYFLVFFAAVFLVVDAFFAFAILFQKGSVGLVNTNSIK